MITFSLLSTLQALSVSCFNSAKCNATTYNTLTNPQTWILNKATDKPPPVSTVVDECTVTWWVTFRSIFWYHHLTTKLCMHQKWESYSLWVSVTKPIKIKILVTLFIYPLFIKRYEHIYGYNALIKPNVISVLNRSYILMTAHTEL